MTASEARRRWFDVLDRAVAGEEIVIERKGARVVIRRQEVDATEGDTPDYDDLICVPDPDQADAWRWSWPGPGEGLTLEGLTQKELTQKELTQEDPARRADGA